MPTTVGWLALVIAASGWLILWLRASANALGLSIFCDWTSDCSAILWTNAPFYLAMLGLVAPTVPISLALHRSGLGSHLLRAVTLAAGITASVVVAVAVAAAYDGMWANYVGPFGLDVPRRQAFLPTSIGTTSWLAWPALAGVWMALTAASFSARTCLCDRGHRSHHWRCDADFAAVFAEPLVTEALMPLGMVLTRSGRRGRHVPDVCKERDQEVSQLASYNTCPNGLGVFSSSARRPRKHDRVAVSRDHLESSPKTVRTRSARIHQKECPREPRPSAITTMRDANVDARLDRGARHRPRDHARGKRPDQFERRDLMGRIEMNGRLVEQEHVCLLRERHRDHRALSLASGKSVDSAGRKRPKIELL